MSGLDYLKIIYFSLCTACYPTKYIKESVEFYEELESTLSDKVTFVRYEDLALDMMEYGKRIYKFIDMNFTKQLQSVIQQSINDDQPVDGAKGNSYTTKRKKSFDQIVNSWRLDKTLTVIIVSFTL